MIPKRHAGPAGTYFITSRTWQSRALFQNPKAAELFVATILHHRDNQAYHLHAFVLMPEHFHLLVTPSAELSLERAVQLVKGGSAHTIRKQLGLAFPVWQRGFSDHRIRESADYAAHLRYIDDNPVKRGLVERAIEYAWSSATGRFLMDSVPQRLKPPIDRNLCGTAEAVP
jgi:putative transposase